MTVIDLPAVAAARERFTIVLAAEVSEMFGNASPEDPSPIQPDLLELATELKGWSEEDLAFSYQSAISAYVLRPRGGGVIDHKLDPTPHHRPCLKWSREYLARIERNFGVPLLDLRGVPG